MISNRDWLKQEQGREDNWSGNTDFQEWNDIEIGIDIWYEYEWVDMSWKLEELMIECGIVKQITPS